MKLSNLVAGAVLSVIFTATGNALVFRPPSIPLITTDPFMQIFLPGDTSTSANATHWDGNRKTTIGLVRVDGTTYSFLGDNSNRVSKTTDQVGLRVFPTRTEFYLAAGTSIRLNVTFLVRLA